MERLNAFIFLILFSVTTFGNVVNVHYCEGEFTNMAMFGTVQCCCVADVAKIQEESCHQTAEKKCHESEEEHAVEDNGDCCDTETIKLSSDTNISLNKATLQTAIVYAINYNLFFFRNDIPKKDLAFRYKSPHHVRDIPILIQSFLI